MIEFISLSFHLFTCKINSFLTGTTFSTAAVGVGALMSLARSIIVVSVSCPIAETIGIEDSKTASANFSSLKTIKSSTLPPPLAIIITLGLSI